MFALYAIFWREDSHFALPFYRLHYQWRILVYSQLDFYHFPTTKAPLILTRVVLVLLPLRLDKSLLLIVAMQSSHPSGSVPSK
jgi:hypothetical protein